MTRQTVLALVSLGAALLGPIPAALAQKATEIYIPIGKSPGLSGTHTAMGRIEAVSAADQTITLAGPQGRRVGRLDSHTRVYLDRSARKLANRYGQYDSCLPGTFCEMKYVDNDPGTRDKPGRIEWVKVRVE